MQLRACVTRHEFEHLPNKARAYVALTLLEVSTEITPRSYARHNLMRAVVCRLHIETGASILSQRQTDPGPYPVRCSIAKHGAVLRFLVSVHAADFNVVWSRFLQCQQSKARRRTLGSRANKQKVCKDSRSITTFMDICLFAKINSLLSQDKTSLKDSSRALGCLEGMYHTHRDKGFSSDDSDEASDEGCPIQRSLEALCHVRWTATSRSLGHAVGISLSQKLDERGVDWMSEEAYAQLESTAAGRSVPHSQWSAKEFLDNVVAGHFEESGDHISGQYCHICRDVSMIRRRRRARSSPCHPRLHGVTFLVTLSCSIPVINKNASWGCSTCCQHSG